MGSQKRKRSDHHTTALETSASDATVCQIQAMPNQLQGITNQLESKLEARCSSLESTVQQHEHQQVVQKKGAVMFDEEALRLSRNTETTALERTWTTLPLLVSCAISREDQRRYLRSTKHLNLAKRLIHKAIL